MEKFTVRIWLNIGVYLMISGLSLYITGETTFADAFMAAALMQDANHTRVIRAFLLSISGAFMLVLLLAVFKIIGPWDADDRLYFGFCNPMAVSWIVYAATLLAMAVLWEKKHYAAMLGLTGVSALFLQFGSQGKTAVLTYPVIIAVLLIQALYEKKSGHSLPEQKWFRTVCCIIPLFLLITCFMVAESAGAREAVLRIGQSFYNRFNMGYYFLRDYGISIWGSRMPLPLDAVTSAKYGYAEGDPMVLDCLYLKLPIKYGVISTVYFFYMTYRSLLGYLRQKNILMLSIFMGLCVYSMMDRIVLLLPFTFIYILALPDKEVL